MSGPEREGGQGDIAAGEAVNHAGEQDAEHLASSREQPRSVSRSEPFRLGPPPPQVMRLSRKALASIGLVAGVGIGGALLYALQPSRNAPPQNLIDTSHAAKSEVVTGAAATYDKVPRLGPPLPGDLGRPILSAQQAGQVVPVPALGPTGGAASDPHQVAAEQARERVQQERAAALGSRLFLGGGSAVRTAAGGTGAGAAGSPSASAAGTAGSNAAPQNNDSGASGQAAKHAFMAAASNHIAVSAERITESVSPNVVQAGSIIPAALMTGIRSDLPGQITAQVTQNVYDSPTGRILLIPQGSRLIGEYDSQVSAGQTRVLLAWDRLILPGGRSILLDRQPGGDASGAAGLQDQVNYHWGNMLHAAAISTLLGIGTQLATTNNDALVQALRYGTQDTINQVGKQFIQREMNVAPTLTIRPGYPLRVILTRDLVLDGQGGER